MDFGGEVSRGCEFVEPFDFFVVWAAYPPDEERAVVGKTRWGLVFVHIFDLEIINRQSICGNEFIYQY